MGAGILTLLCLGGVGVFISLYDEATETKSTAPDAVVVSFLQAYLVDRDDQEASFHTCRSGADLNQMAALREEFVRREEGFGVKVVVRWEELTVTGNGDERRAVSAKLLIIGTSNGETRSQRIESWTFDVAEDDGWRVCGASEAT
jgi:hypothetical protein